MKNDCTPQSRHIRFPPKINQRYDLVILGAGCAGLSLAYNLSADPDYKGRVLLVDRKVDYDRDRSWCFFAPDDPTLVPESLIAHRWPIAIVRRGDDSLRLSLDSKPYTLVDASFFYQQAFERLIEDSRFSIALGHTISDEDVLDEGGDITIRLDEQSYVTYQVVDSRTDHLIAPSSAQLWQVFLGYEIETDRPVFNSEEATLMDFIEDQSHLVSFMYELPTSQTKALMEYTVFSATCINPESLRPLLEKIIDERLIGKAFRISRIEKGVIPMGLADQSQSTNQRWLKAGLMAGAARPSTGYAFLRIQRWARKCSEKIRWQSKMGVAHKDPILTSTMDRMFLNVLAMTPHHASRLFFDLFKNTPTPALIRFLNDEGRWLDHILVILSLPKIPFLRRLFLK